MLHELDFSVWVCSGYSYIKGSERLRFNVVSLIHHFPNIMSNRNSSREGPIASHIMEQDREVWAK